MASHKGIGKYVTAVREAAFGRRVPVVIYQMGKVGSSSIRDSLLNAYPGPVFHVHWFLPWRKQDPAQFAGSSQAADIAREIEHQRQAARRLSLLGRLRSRVHEVLYNGLVYRRVTAGRGPVRVITMVRDPVSANLSMFFQRFEQYAGRPFSEESFTVDDILEIFRSRYILSWPLTWFEKELRPRLGIDVFSQPFPHDRGYARFSQGDVELLVLRTECDDAVKERAVAEFLDLPGLRLTMSNVSENKAYAEHYRRFKERIRLPGDVLDAMLESRYALHFYTPEERAAVRTRWIQAPDAAGRTGGAQAAEPAPARG
jgi:Putative capsular polysaccharide synthesis protein